MDIRIVPLRSEYVRQTAALDKLCFSEPWSEKSFWEVLENPLAVYRVALCGEKLVGYAGMYLVENVCDIMNIAVHPDNRRCGIANKLMKSLVNYAKDNNAEVIELEVRLGNASARAFYEKLGFVRDGIRKNYYSFPKEDAVLMSLALGETK